jgi:hypothetical protein
MPQDVHWIGPRVRRILILIFAINAGAFIGDLVFGPVGSPIGATAAVAIAIVRDRRVAKQSTNF